VWNPPNPYLTEHWELLGEPPPAPLEVYEDHSQSILSRNDSPDLGFRWSVNPYRGCFHACAYCLDGETPILMADGTTKRLQDLRIGDRVYGTVVRGDYRRYAKTSVLAIWSVIKPAYRITLANGAQLITSGDHRFLTTRGWKHVTGAQRGHARRPHVTPHDNLLGVGAFGAPAIVRKKHLEGQAVKNSPKLGVVSVEPLGLHSSLFDITTGTGDFIANGVISHNCYARPTHEYFGLGAGTDFERKIVVKPRAPALLERAFLKPSWRGELLVFSGVTDCYQPLEAAWKLTRGCLEVCLRFRNPVAVITKSLLIRRDAPLLAALAREAQASVSISIPFLDEAVARAIEPGAPTIRRRFETMGILAKAGVPVGIGVAPIIPGLNDHAIPGLLQEAKRCGASFAFKTLLRLPGSVKAVFFHRLQAVLPLQAAKIEHRIRAVRDGALSDSRFGHRHHGEGTYWQAIEQAWAVWARRLGFHQEEDTPAASTFRRPTPAEFQPEFPWA
jgi:DNA repair photolyase